MSAEGVAFLTVMPKRSILAGSSLGGSHASFQECSPAAERRAAVESAGLTALLRCLFEGIAAPGTEATQSLHGCTARYVWPRWATQCPRFYELGSPGRLRGVLVMNVASGTRLYVFESWFLPPTCSVSLGKLLNFSMPQFTCLKGTLKYVVLVAIIRCALWVGWPDGGFSSLGKDFRLPTECVGAECRWESCLLESVLGVSYSFPSTHPFHLCYFPFAHLTDHLPEMKD